MNIVFKNSLWLFSDKLIKLLSSFLISVWIIRYFGPIEFGKFSFAYSIAFLLITISALGTENFIIADLVRYSKNINKIIIQNIYIQIFSGIILFIFGIFFILAFKYKDLKIISYTIILTIPLLFKFLNIGRIFFESKIDIKKIVIAENIIFLIYSLIRIFILECKLDIIFIIMTYSFEYVTIYFVNFFLFSKQFKIFKFTYTNLIYIKRILKSSFPIFVSGLAIILYMKVDQLMIGILLNDRSLGYYSVGVRLSEYWYFIPVSIASSYYPNLVRLYNSDKLTYLLKLRNLHIILFYISISLAIFIQLFANSIISLLYGSLYLESVNVLKIHIWSGIFVFLGVASGNFFQIEGLHNYTLTKSLLGLLLNIILNWFWIPIYGINGAAFATLISQIFASSIFLLFSNKTRMLLKFQVYSFRLDFLFPLKKL